MRPLVIGNNSYGIEEISISGLSTTNEPSQRELEKIISLADNQGFHYILFETKCPIKISGDCPEGNWSKGFTYP